ncbi:glycosyltransferase 61 family protein [Methylobacterium oryzae CBMB20]
MGYTLVDPGAVGWKRQIEIFSSATHIVGYGGSGLHNTVFTGSNATVLTIQSNQTFNYLQTSIATIRGHQISYLFGEALDGFNSRSWETAFKVDERLLRVVLERLL